MVQPWSNEQRVNLPTFTGPYHHCRTLNLTFDTGQAEMSVHNNFRSKYDELESALLTVKCLCCRHLPSQWNACRRPLIRYECITHCLCTFRKFPLRKLAATTITSHTGSTGTQSNCFIEELSTIHQLADERHCW